MNSVEQQLDKQKSQYREIFLKSAEEIQKRLEQIKPEGFSGELLDRYEPDSVGRQWQKDALTLLNQEISHEVYRKLRAVRPAAGLHAVSFHLKNLSKKPQTEISLRSSSQVFLFLMKGLRTRKRFIQNILNS